MGEFFLCAVQYGLWWDVGIRMCRGHCWTAFSLGPEWSDASTVHRGFGDRFVWLRGELGHAIEVSIHSTSQASIKPYFAITHWTLLTVVEKCFYLEDLIIMLHVVHRLMFQLTLGTVNLWWMGGESKGGSSFTFVQVLLGHAESYWIHPQHPKKNPLCSTFTKLVNADSHSP